MAANLVARVNAERVATDLLSDWPPDSGIQAALPVRTSDQWP
ncbi:hypothetical protein [Ruegeria sp. HKCCD7559]|nr:hypothetical protein [Ruegeria sp. HKCCD7559]